MRLAFCFALVLVLAPFAGCSSSTSAPSCQNPSPNEQACNACSGSHCSSQVSALTSQCPSYVSCYEACDCGDSTCLAGCAMIASSGVATDPCPSAASSLALCVEFNCPATVCASTLDGGAPTCGAGEVACNGACVNPQNDPDNCGGCGMGCGLSMQCAAGVCECALMDDTRCNGSCVDEANDPSNCGGCGLQCQAAETCVGGRCQCTGAGTMCDGTCVDEQTDIHNCGGCGTSCPTAQVGGPVVCQGGSCACPSGRSLCGGTFCVDKDTDARNCGACGTACGSATPECSRGACIPTPVPNCAPGGAGLSNCGAAAESCCTSLDVTGGTFFRTYDPATPDAGTPLGPDGGALGEADPAAVSTFSLDKYLVTVGRFRQFVNAWDEYTGYYPPAGSGIHAYLNGGKGLVSLAPAPAGDGGVSDGGADATLPPVTYEPGWATDNNTDVAPTAKNLACDPTLATWTPTAGSNENLPITCVTWAESYAFCIWDGGFLPSEAEWEYAAAGGSSQLEYPWGSAPPGANNAYAIYGNGANECYYPTGALAACAGLSSIAPVGTPALGAGVWGQLDLAGEVQQWTLDAYAPFVDPSSDGAYLGATTTRSLRGTNFGAQLVPNLRGNIAPGRRLAWVGFRCGRAP
jgi:sulfatase modifying factor 1